MGTVPTPWTMGANGVVPSTAYNTGARDVMSFLLRPPGCIARLAANQSIPNNANTLINFDTEEYDSDSMLSAPSTTMTINTPGVFSISAAVAYDQNATGVRFASVLINGLVTAGTYVPNVGGGTPTSVTIGFERLCAVGDTLSLQVFQTSGGALNVSGTSWFPARLSAIWRSSST